MIHYGERTDEFCDETIVIEECETMKDNLTKFVDDIANSPSTVMAGDVVERGKIREAIEGAYAEGQVDMRDAVESAIKIYGPIDEYARHVLRQSPPRHPH